MADQPTPTWKFWHPLAFWQVILLLLVFNVGFQLIGVGLREGLGIGFFSGPLASGLTGGLSVAASMLVMKKVAKKRREAT